MWENKITYWAWRETAAEAAKRTEAILKGLPVDPIPPTPTVKKLDYCTVNEGKSTEHKLCIGVWDNDKYTALHRDELNFFLRQHGH